MDQAIIIEKHISPVTAPPFRTVSGFNTYSILLNKEMINKTIEQIINAVMRKLYP